MTWPSHELIPGINNELKWIFALTHLKGASLLQDGQWGQFVKENTQPRGSKAAQAWPSVVNEFQVEFANRISSSDGRTALTSQFTEQGIDIPRWLQESNPTSSLPEIAATPSIHRLHECMIADRDYLENLAGCIPEFLFPDEVARTVDKDERRKASANTRRILGEIPEVELRRLTVPLVEDDLVYVTANAPVWALENPLPDIRRKCFARIWSKLSEVASMYRLIRPGEESDDDNQQKYLEVGAYDDSTEARRPSTHESMNGNVRHSPFVEAVGEVYKRATQVQKRIFQFRFNTKPDVPVKDLPVELGIASKSEAEQLDASVIKNRRCKYAEQLMRRYGRYLPFLGVLHGDFKPHLASANLESRADVLYRILANDLNASQFVTVATRLFINDVKQAVTSASRETGVPLPTTNHDSEGKPIPGTIASKFSAEDDLRLQLWLIARYINPRSVE